MCIHTGEDMWPSNGAIDFYGPDMSHWRTKKSGYYENDSFYHLFCCSVSNAWFGHSFKFSHSLTFQQSRTLWQLVVTRELQLAAAFN